MVDAGGNWEAFEPSRRDKVGALRYPTPRRFSCKDVTLVLSWFSGFMADGQLMICQLQHRDPVLYVVILLTGEAQQWRDVYLLRDHGRREGIRV